MTKQEEAALVIEFCGGPQNLATMRGITCGAVSQWRTNGVPKLQLELLKKSKRGLRQFLEEKKA